MVGVEYLIGGCSGGSKGGMEQPRWSLAELRGGSRNSCQPIMLAAPASTIVSFTHYTKSVKICLKESCLFFLRTATTEGRLRRFWFEHTPVECLRSWEGHVTQ